ncbi:MAG: PTS system mannose/fructose/sorbose family transporter subunit IID [Atopobium sp.]|uniref:PTS system mannose/fructose/sorbose family transporter subunit IID n=1 Tax=Atopobium sp. TaxID=1872650 RepID=UPI002A827B4D|nr:PTS system mannose/fructose/sorbose family transporter subunit IID [Atopobium sp.]MDY4522626.1 PTS system mannose/fructose/sorbose family transporter subunit IID [Atopobium sp.]
MTSNVPATEPALGSAAEPTTHKLTKADLIASSLNLGSLGMEFSWTYYKQMNLAFALMVNKLLEKIYAGNPEGYKAALVRHMAFFNITVQFAPFVGGIAMSMEERVARGEMEPDAINEVKSALMGPLSGVGDSIFLATLRVVAAGVAISLAQQGNALAPLVYLLIYNIPAFLTRVYGVQLGYNLGVNFLEQAQKSGLMDKIMFAAGIVGAMVIGSMTKDMFWASVILPIGTGESAKTLQEILDGVMPGIVGMGFMGLYYWMLGKKISPTWIIIFTMILGVVGVYFGFLG